MEGRDEKLCPPIGASTPWLVYTHGNGRAKKIQTFSTISPLPPNNKTFLKSIPSLCGKSIFASYHGWLILRDHNYPKNFSLWNPTSLKTINLPPLDALGDDDQLFSCTLLSPHTGDSTFMLLLFSNGVAFSCRPMRDNCMWVVRRKTELLGQSVRIVDNVTCNGILYSCASVILDDGTLRTYFVVIKGAYDDYDNGDHVSGCPLTLILLKEKIRRCSFTCNQFIDNLVESCGRIYSVSQHGRGDKLNLTYAVEVEEWNSCSMEWVEVKCLGDRAFFVGENCCTWCWKSSNPELGSIEGNTVYLVHPNDKSLYLYKLEDRSFRPFLPCPNFWGAPTWVLPMHQRLSPCQVHEVSVEKLLSHEEGCKAVVQYQELQEQNDDMQGRLMLCKLPHDLLALITQKVHLFDYTSFRATCKDMHLVAPPAWRRTNNSLPLFVFFENDDQLCRVMDPCRSDSRYIIIPKSFKLPVALHFSKDNWLLVQSDNGESLHFFNPFTGVSGKFPSYDLITCLSSVGFSTCPTSPDCVTVAIIDSFSYMLICFFRSGEEKWRVGMYDHVDVTFVHTIASPVYYKGVFYFLDETGYLGAFEVAANGVGVWDVYGRPPVLSDCFDSSHLVECDGELLSVFIGEMGRWVRVFKFNWSKMKWVSVKSLGNNMLFISRSSCLSAVATYGETRNRIYLPRRHGNGIVFYNLDTGKYGTLNGEDTMEDFSGTSEHPRCCWI